MNRRSFLALLGTELALPYVPKKVYSFGYPFGGYDTKVGIIFTNCDVAYSFGYPFGGYDTKVGIIFTNCEYNARGLLVPLQD